MMDVRLILGDCIEKMKELPAESVDAVITDPPYGVDYLSPRTDNHHRLQNDADADIGALYARFMPEVRRLLKPKGVCCCCCGGGGKRPSSALATLEFIKHLQLIQTVIWSKGKTDGSFVGLGWRYRPSYETVLVGAKDAADFNFYPKYASNVFVCKTHIPHAEDGDHPTQKPIPLMEFFIRNHTWEGDTILDPFMGCGTTGVAALKHGRNFIGIEIDEGYFKVAESRIRPWQNQSRLSGAAPPGAGTQATL
jgi:DNA modification methylase